jgi:hypothetical protein
VLVFTVLAQALPVVGGDDEQRVLSGPRAIEPLDEPPELRVDVRDLAVVGRAGETRAVGRRRLVGGMGIEQMQPGEDRPASRLRQPSEGTPHDVLGAPLEARVADGGFLARPERVIHEVEAAEEAGRARHGVGADEGPGGVTLPAEHARERFGLRVERCRLVVADAMLVRIEAREE